MKLAIKIMLCAFAITGLTAGLRDRCLQHKDHISNARSSILSDKKSLNGKNLPQITSICGGCKVSTCRSK